MTNHWSGLPCFITPWQTTYECRKTFRMMDDDEVPLAFQVQHLLCLPFLSRRTKLYLSSKLWKLWLSRCGIKTKDRIRVTKKDVKLVWSVTWSLSHYCTYIWVWLFIPAEVRSGLCMNLIKILPRCVFTAFENFVKRIVEGNSPRWGQNTGGKILGTKYWGQNTGGEQLFVTKLISPKTVSTPPPPSNYWPFHSQQRKLPLSYFHISYSVIMFN